MIYKFRSVDEGSTIEIEKIDENVSILFEGDDLELNFNLNPKDVNNFRDALYQVQREIENEKKSELENSKRDN